LVRYSDELIEEIRTNNDIVDVISQYVILKRSGRNFFGLCPFHKENAPSFSVSPDKQIFHCFGCGAGGNVIHFISKIENIDFRETLEILSERAGIQLPTNDYGEDNTKQYLKSKIYEINEQAALFYHQNLYQLAAKEAQEYVKKRKLDNKTLKTFLIGYSGNYNELYMFLKNKGFSDEEILSSSLVSKNESGKFIDRFRKRLMFPIQDVRNKIIAFGGRVLDNSLPKYINSPENLIYSKGRNLFGLNIAKKNELKKIIIVEGYMDAVSLYQRGITNVVASLGTAMTEAQGRLLRKYGEQVIIGYDSDGAGQAATIRCLEILNNLGCDVRILQIEEAKDPDEFVIKYGSARFEKLVDNAISLIEFKVKVLKQNLNIENVKDKIKFLNQIAKILSTVTNKMEKEVYIEKISKEYNISKEAIYAETNKIEYNKQVGNKILEKNRPIKMPKKENKELQTNDTKREDMIIKLLVNEQYIIYCKIRNIIKPEDFKSEINKIIVKKLYDQFEKLNRNIDNILNLFSDEEIISKITGLLAENYEITDIEKCVQYLLKNHIQDKLINDKNEIIEKLKNDGLSEEERHALEKNLNDVIVKIARNK